MHATLKICHALTTVLVWEIVHPALAQAATDVLLSPADPLAQTLVREPDILVASRPLGLASPESIDLPESSQQVGALSTPATSQPTSTVMIAQNMESSAASSQLPSTELQLSLSEAWPIAIDDSTLSIDAPNVLEPPVPQVDPVSRNPITPTSVPPAAISAVLVADESSPTAPANPTAVSSTTSGLKLESLTTDFQNESDGNRTNRMIEPTAQFKLPNGDRLQVKSGWNTFQQSGIRTIQNFPLQGAWVKKLGDNQLKLGGGLDVFNRLSIQPKLNAELEVPLGVEVAPNGKLNRGVVLKGLVDYGAYKFNAKTLEQGINVLHVKPQVYWQIDPKTSLYSHYQLGLYRDGNVEHQTYSRLERKFGQFFVAANLFTWNYKADQELNNGYFSPQQFLTYNGEVGWAGDIAKGLKCRVTAALGQQALNGNNSSISRYNGRCTAAIAPNIALDFGYGFSNERKQNLNVSNYQNHSVTGQLRMTF
ncbi:hypothetical protein IQ266_08670 [filamentous cyanobacterium LEGE 11480]|uniref:Uncharacterized protein n=1 Tax=Romeriopsis navalis LEGE 11480 TaxID=2777977 RepID=A0A928VPP9_9CYAN|nr:hypothetical protein [Romeriopsis navalis]MBE9029799.1 hypothetical protein [Romeriopsis navalis LEGE 11480]